MKEKQRAKLTESCRLMQDSSKAYLFRSGAANDEFDGLARYSERKLAFGKLGGTASSSRPMWDGSFFICATRPGQFGWYRERRSSSQRTGFSIFLLRFSQTCEKVLDARKSADGVRLILRGAFVKQMMPYRAFRKEES